MRSVLLGLSLVLTASFWSPVLAVQPVSQPGYDFEWSGVTEDPFEGMIVFDRHFDDWDGFEFVTSWSRQAIRATYTWTTQKLVGYRTVWKTRQVYRDGRYQSETYSEQEPIYNTHTYERHPQAIMFSLNGVIYTYTEGQVPLDLAAALASAPEGKQLIRLVWEDGTTTDMPIGRKTVAAWKIIFASTP